MRFCNKQCEKEAHTKEKSTKKEPENPGDTEDLLKKEMEAEMKRREKQQRRSNKLVKTITSSGFKGNKDTLKKFETLSKR